MSDKKPLPLMATRRRSLCPVCGHTSYSAAGVHPQCSVRQADARQLQRIQGDRKAPVVKRPPPAKPTQRVCPQCKVLQHVRKACTCGHVFTINSHSGAGET